MCKYEGIYIYVMRKSADDIKRCVTVPIHNHMKTHPGKKIKVRKRGGGQQQDKRRARVEKNNIVSN